jgi:hypothetical protein
MKEIKIRFKSNGPMLMHSPRDLDVFDPLTREKNKVARGKKKTDETLLALRRIEWELSMYFDQKIGPWVPSMSLRASIAKGASMNRDGMKVKRAVMPLEERCPLKYNGPRTLEKMYGDGSGPFVDVRPVSLPSGTTIMRARARFNEWETDAAFAFDEAVISSEELIDAAGTAGRLFGIGDFRPDRGGVFGRFSIEVVA